MGAVAEGLKKIFDGYGVGSEVQAVVLADVERLERALKETEAAGEDIRAKNSDLVLREKNLTATLDRALADLRTSSDSRHRAAVAQAEALEHLRRCVCQSCCVHVRAAMALLEPR